MHQPGQEGGATHQFQRWAPQGRWCTPHWAWSDSGHGDQSSPLATAEKSSEKHQREGASQVGPVRAHTHTHALLHYAS